MELPGMDELREDPEFVRGGIMSAYELRLHQLLQERISRIEAADVIFDKERDQLTASRDQLLANLGLDPVLD